uniref:Uncharacterized protein n=1 Tax=Cannabis sativa TaxID=3483 RepID=A0A803PI36_CANSA
MYPCLVSNGPQLKAEGGWSPGTRAWSPVVGCRRMVFGVVRGYRVLESGCSLPLAGSSAYPRRYLYLLILSLHKVALSSNNFCNWCSSSDSRDHSLAKPFIIGIGQAALRSLFGQSIFVIGVGRATPGSLFGQDIFIKCIGRATLGVTLWPSHLRNRHWLSESGVTLCRSILRNQRSPSNFGGHPLAKPFFATVGTHILWGCFGSLSSLPLMVNPSFCLDGRELITLDRATLLIEKCLLTPERHPSYFTVMP